MILSKILYWTIIIAVLAVLAILVTGIGGFFRGGEFNRKYGNKLMRARIFMQAVAVALILLFIFIQSADK